MLTDLVVRNFRSLYDVRLHLKPLTLIIGPNASGKSNLFKALRFLHDAVAGDVRDWQSYDAQVDELTWFGIEESGERPGGFELSLSFQHISSLAPQISYTAALQASSGRSLEVQAESLRTGGGGSESWLERSGRKIRRHVGVRGDPLKEPRSETARSRRSLTLRDEGPSSRLPALGDVYRHVEGWRFFEVDPRAARRPSFVPAVPEEVPPLAGDASNLSAFLYALWRLRNPDLDAVMEAITRSIELPQKIQLEHEAEQGQGGTQASYFFLESPFGENQPIRPDSISDGTIRLLAHIALLLADQSVTLACLEEPDHGLHPRLMFYLSDALRQAVQQVPAVAPNGHQLQVLIATHSPELMDCFDLTSESEYIQVVVAERSENGETVFIPVTAERFAPWLEKYRLGEALRRHFL